MGEGSNRKKRRALEWASLYRHKKAEGVYNSLGLQDLKVTVKKKKEV